MGSSLTCLGLEVREPDERWCGLLAGRTCRPIGGEVPLALGVAEDAIGAFGPCKKLGGEELEETTELLEACQFCGDGGAKGLGTGYGLWLSAS